jgi:hypothetical protein
MKMNFVSGSSIAIAAVALAMGGATLTLSGAAKAADTVMCSGINACKGKSACKSASNECKGQNACKGHGWLPEKSAAACKAKGGTVV